MNKPDLNIEYLCIHGKKYLVQVTEGYIIPIMNIK